MSRHELNRRSLIKLGGASVGLAATGELLSSIPAAAKPRRHCADGWLPLSFIPGFNEQNTHGPGLTAGELEDAFSQKRARLIRYGGGTTANFWDWRKGWVLDDDKLPPIKPANNVKGKKNWTAWHLEDFKTFCDDTGYVPLYDVNILTATLEDQLTMLHHASDIGLPVRYVELGNEFYLKNYTPVIPTVVDYAAKAYEWASAIKSDFPDADIAAVGWDRNKIFTTTERQTTWNAGLRPYLEDGDALSAITVHPYTFINYVQRLHGQITDLSLVNIQRLLALASDPRRDLGEVAELDLPRGTAIWPTEYNLVDLANRVVANRWIHAIWMAATTIHMVHVPQITAATYHSLSGEISFSANFHPAYAQNFYNTYGTDFVPWGLTAAGVSVQALDIAMRAATHYEAMEFAESESVRVEVAGVQRTYDDLLGIRLKAGHEISGVIVNMSERSKTLNLHHHGFAPNGRWTQHAADPSTVVADATTDVTTTEGPVCAHVVLAPYSITIVGGHD